MKQCALAIIVTLMSWLAIADIWTDSETGIEWVYYVDNGVWTIAPRKVTIPASWDGTIEVPSTIGTVSVTRLSQEAFRNLYALKKVVISEGIDDIQWFAFSGCTNLTTVSLPSTLTNIATAAFNNCKALKEIELPAGLQVIGQSAFSCCLALKDINIPESVTRIDSGAFNRCTGLGDGIIVKDGWLLTVNGNPSSVSIPANVKIVSDAVAENPNLTSVTFPEGFQIIPEGMFSDCSGLKKITIPDTVTSIGLYAFYRAGLTSIVLPKSIKHLAGGSFYDCQSLTSVEVYCEPTNIFPCAFGNCRNISSIVLPDTLAISDLIGDDEITFLSRLTNVTILASSGSIRSDACTYAERYCTNVVSLTLGNGIKNIAAHAFMNFSKLPEIELPSTVTSLYANAFDGCASLKAIHYSGAVAPTVIGAFDDVHQDCTIYVYPGSTGWDVEIPGKWKGLNIDYIRKPDGGPYKETVNGAEWTFTIKDGKATVGSDESCVPAIGQVSSPNVIIPSSLGGCPVVAIGEDAFYDCGWNWGSPATVTIPSGVCEIKTSAFKQCCMESVNLPETLETIGREAFRTCYYLKSITIPSSVTNIADAAFRDCPALKAVVVPATVQNVGNEAFAYCMDLESVEVNTEITEHSTSLFAVFSGCSSLTSVTFGANVSWIWPGMFQDCTSLTSIELPSNIKRIGEWAFYRSGLQSLTLPDSITNVDYAAFAENKSLQSVSLSAGLRTISDRVFQQCYCLHSVDIPEGVVSIGEYAFEDCYGMISVSIPDNVTEIGYRAFKNCYGLGNGVVIVDDCVLFARGTCDATTILPDNVRLIAGGAFDSEFCSGIERVVLPASLDRLCSSSFREATITAIELPQGITDIPASAFCYCASLTSVTLPANLRTIGERAFYSCKKLTAIDFPASLTAVRIYAFDDCAALTNMTYVGSQAFKMVRASGVSKGCTLYVRADSTGWDVDIPGTWNGVNIAYSLSERTVEGVGKLNVDNFWLKQYAPGKSDAEINELLAQLSANGIYKNWECYVLGLDPTNASSKIEAYAPQSQSTDSIDIGFNLNPPAGSGYAVNYSYVKDGVEVVCSSSGVSIDLTGEGDPSGLYAIKVKLVPDSSTSSTSEIVVDQTVGVRKSTSSTTRTAIAVPWGELGDDDGQSISVANLVKTANLTTGDKLYVYNAQSHAYETWQLSAGKIWEPLATYVINDDGSVSTESAGEPTSTKVSRGSAVWLERQDATEPFYLYGGYTSGTISTVITSGSTAEPYWNFVASPSLEDFDLNRITGASTDDKIVVSTSSGPKIYTYKNGAWGCDVNTTVTRTLPDSGAIEVVKKTRDTTNTTIPAGTGFMYVSQGGSPTINW